MNNSNERKNVRPTRVAFVGNPNCGKTTLFNAFTGARLKVANWPGVTVERKEGEYNFHGERYVLVDLPGAYSLDSYSMDETVTRDYILGDEVDIIVNVVDASSLDRNLYLTLQLAELGKPVVVALNMMDIIKERGMEIDLHRMPEMLGMPIIPVSARKRTGLEALMHAVEHHKAKTLDPTEHHHERSTEHPHDHHSEYVVVYGDKIENAIDTLICELRAAYPKINNYRWHAIKLLSGDAVVKERYPLPDPGRLIGSMESAIVEERFEFIEEIVSETVFGRTEKVRNTDRADKILTHKVFGLPIFLLIMGAVFALTFTLGDFLKGFMEMGLDKLCELTAEGLDAIHCVEWLNSLIVDGILVGVGGVITFLPNIVILFLAMAVLEDSGYMSRVAYVMDGLMSSLGLSGKSFIPMVLGFGCSVPAVMASRTLEDPRDRRRTIMITPFMSCSAKIPVYVLLSGLFFGKWAWLVSLSMYVIGIVIAIIVAKVQSLVVRKKSGYTLLIELPEYKRPNGRTVGIYVWEKSSHYLKRAGTIIFIISIAMWLLTSFGTGGYVGAEGIDESFAALIGRVIAPIFAPMGLGEWQSSLSLITGMAAKEVVVSSMEIIFAGDVAAGLASIGFGAAAAYAMMLFCLLCAPCMAAIATIKAETRSWKFTGLCLLVQTAVAWVVATGVYQAIRLFS